MATTTYPQSTATAISNSKSSLLRRVLYGDVIFSICSALLFIVASGAIAEFLGITNSHILGVFDGAGFISFLGFGLALYTTDVLYVASRPTINTMFAWGFVLADFIWVILSWILLATGALALSDMGNWAVLIVSDVVLAFGIATAVGIRRINR